MSTFSPVNLAAPQYRANPPQFPSTVAGEQSRRASLPCSCPLFRHSLADPEQRIANLQRQLGECKAERDEALADRAAITEVLQAINGTPG